MRLKISPFAENDLRESIDYYENQRDGLGDEFFERVKLTFKQIMENPNQYPKEVREMRKAQITVFPFNIFFVADDLIVYILAIYHESRNPKILKERYRKM